MNKGEEKKNDEYEHDSSDEEVRSSLEPVFLCVPSSMVSKTQVSVLQPLSSILVPV